MTKTHACKICQKRRQRCQPGENSNSCTFCIERNLECTRVVKNSASDSDPEDKAAIRSDSSTSTNSNPTIQQSQAIPLISGLDPDDFKANDSDAVTRLDHVTEEIHPKDQKQVSAQILPQDPAVPIKEEVSRVQSDLTTNRQQVVFEGAVVSALNIGFTERFPYNLSNHFFLPPGYCNAPVYSSVRWEPVHENLFDLQSMLPVSDHSKFDVGSIYDYDTRIAPYSPIPASASFSPPSKHQGEKLEVDHSRQSNFLSEYDLNHTEPFPLRDSASKRIFREDDPLPSKRHRTELHSVALSEVMIEAAYEYIRNRLLHLDHEAKASCKSQPAKVLPNSIFNVTCNFEEESKLDEYWRRDESRRLLYEYKGEVSKIGTWEETDCRYVDLCKIGEGFQI